jgi:hypothetical protein
MATKSLGRLSGGLLLWTVFSLFSVLPSVFSAAYSGPPKGAFSLIGVSRNTVLQRYGPPPRTAALDFGRIRWSYDNHLAGTEIDFSKGQIVEHVSYYCHINFPGGQVKPPCATLAQLASQEGLQLPSRIVLGARQCNEHAASLGGYWLSFRGRSGSLHQVRVRLYDDGTAPEGFLWKTKTAFNPSSGLNETTCAFMRRNWQQDPPENWSGATTRWDVFR